MSKTKKHIRSAFRNSVFKRDGFTCQICGKVYSPQDSDPSKKIINAHHITDRSLMPHQGYVVENGITVCDEQGSYPGNTSCHMIVEQWHISGGDITKVQDEHRPESLYKKVGSSYELAYRRSIELR